MRTKNSIKSAISSVITNCFYIIFGILTQAIFIRILGKEYLGLNSLFSNIITMLTIAELGIGNAIIFKLYKPMSQDNVEEVNSLMNFYGKSYKKISIIILLIGLLIIPFLQYIVGEINIKINLYVIYMLYLFDTFISYLFIYKKSLLQADQKNYIVNYVHLFYIFLMNIAQMIILFIYSNYVAYLIIRIISRFLENITISLYVERKYSKYLKDSKLEISDKVKNDINKNVRALLLHKIAGYVVSGTDSIIISKFINVIMVGMYSNYLFIINSVNSLFGQIFTSITGSVGNLLVEKNKDKNYEVFARLEFANFIIYSFATIMIYSAANNFITVWIGKDYVLSTLFVLIISIYFYLRGMRGSIMVFKEAAGIYYADRFVPIFEAVINLISSIVLVVFFGINGVIIGTIISTLVLYLYSYPKYVYEPVFEKKGYRYIINQLKYFLILSLIIIIYTIIIKFIIIKNIYLNLIVCSIIAFIIYLIVIFLLYRKDKNFLYYISMIREKIFSKFKKEK